MYVGIAALPRVGPSKKAFLAGFLVAAVLALGGCSAREAPALDGDAGDRQARDAASKSDVKIASNEPVQVAVDGQRPRPSYPNLGTVPDRPTEVTSTRAREAREALREGLIADTERARYSDEALRARTATVPPPPVSFEPVMQAQEFARSPERLVGSAQASSESVPVTAPLPLVPVAPATPTPLPPTPEVSVPQVQPPAPPNVAASPPAEPRAVVRPPKVTPPPPMPQVTVPRAPATESGVAAAAPPAPPSAAASPPAEPRVAGSVPKVTPPPVPGQAEPSQEAPQREAPQDQQLAATPQLQQEARVPPVPSPPAAPPSHPGADSAVKIATIYFDEGSSRLGEGDRVLVSQLVEVAMQKDGKLRIVGHASMGGSAGERYEISLKRANAVAEELIRLGVPRDRLIVAAEGDKQPIYEETTPAGAAGNRRTEIFLMDAPRT